MRLSRNALPTAVAAAALVFAAVAATPTTAQTRKEQTVTVGGAPMYPSRNIIQNAVNSKDHTTLVAAVKATGLVETLQGPGPFTVFAPTDEAFAKLPEGTLEDLLKPENREKLQAILKYHVVSGKVMAADVVKLDSATTVQGQKVKIQTMGGKVMVDNAHVATADVAASNGVIHVIDAVILPK